VGGESADLRAAELTRRQDGVIGASDLRAVGLERDAVRRRVARGVLHPIHPGVFAFGSPDLSQFGHMRAALLACGDDFRLSHAAAVYAWEFIDEWRPPVDVLGPRLLRRRGINVHRTNWLPPEDRATRRGLPVTSPARSILDFGTTADTGLHEHAIAAALRKRWVTEAELRELVATARPGAPALRAQLRRLGGAQFSRSKAERIVLRLCREARLPGPVLNADVHGRERDLVWAEARVVAEFDGDAFHWSPATKRADAVRDAELELRGWRTVRLTWHELTEEPLAATARIAGALALGYAAWASGSTRPASSRTASWAASPTS
jgi:very-short-patch-repair endonuclease